MRQTLPICLFSGSARASTAVLLLACGLLSCGHDAKHEGSELKLAIRSDLGAALGYIRVETLEASGDGVYDTSWARVGDACPTTGMQLVTLGSLIDLMPGVSDTARLRVTGFGPTGAQSGATVLLQQRIDVPLVPASGYVLLDLTSVCLQTRAACASDQSCAPDSGACEAPPRVSALPALPATTPDLHCLAKAEPPPLVGAATPLDASTPPISMMDAALLDAGVAASDATAADAETFGPMVTAPLAECQTGDGRCPTGCTYANDRDCRAAQGSACNVEAECGVGLSCADGVCCESACTGECSRCDLPDFQGLCRDVLQIRKAPLNAPNYTAACATRHLSLQTDAMGAVTYSCDSGYRNCEQTSDSLASVIKDGCNTPLGTAAHCSDCNPCPYGVCDKGECKAEPAGVLQGATATALHLGAAQGVMPPFGQNATVHALGALVDRRHATCSIQLALYQDENGSSHPNTLVKQTALVDASVDHSFLEVLKSAGTNRVEAMLDPPISLSSDHTYWVFAVSNGDCDVWLSGEENQDYMCRITVHDGGFPSSNPTPEDCTYGSQVNLYAVTTMPSE